MNIVATVTLALLLSQYQRRYPAVDGTAGEANVGAVATFQGKFKSAGKKYLYVAVEDGETMQMYITSKTKFVRDGKPAKPSDFTEDEAVVVEASRDLRMNLLAVRIENAKPPKPETH